MWSPYVRGNYLKWPGPLTVGYNSNREQKPQSQEPHPVQRYEGSSWTRDWHVGFIFPSWKTRYSRMKDRSDSLSELQISLSKPNLCRLNSKVIVTSDLRKSSLLSFKQQGCAPLWSPNISGWHVIRVHRFLWAPRCFIVAIVKMPQARSNPRCRKKREKIKNLITPKSFITHSDIVVL